MPDTLPPASRFLRAAQRCRMRDLERLSILGELVQSLGELIHGLQRERGASSIVLGSHGASFQERLSAQVATCQALEIDVRAQLGRLDEKLDDESFGARFYVRGALAFRALETLSSLRAQILALTIAPQDALKEFSDLIGCLLAVAFEVADIAVDPDVSRSLLALANFAQGKEYAGQERATIGAAFSRGRVEHADQRRLRDLIGSQDQAFRVFGEFAAPVHLTAFQELQRSDEAMEVKQLRRVALARDGLDGRPEVLADAWFRHSTARIDAMQRVETRMTGDLNTLCVAKLAEAQAAVMQGVGADAVIGEDQVPVAMLVPDVSSGGVGLYTLDGSLPKPMRSILDVVHAQSRRLTDVSHQLEAARAALTERKTIERARGLLMVNRRLSEQQAYQLMRDTAMTQNKRMVEIAEAIISMAQIL